MITDNTAKWRVGSISTPQVNSGDGKLPVGHIYISMGSSAPAGSLPLWGQLFSRSTYKDLWDWVNKHPEQLLSESEWQTKYIENNGLVPFYSEGTDSTNFRLPNCFNLGSDMMDYVVEDWQQGQNWYRVWKSGWLEQGGGFPVQGTYVERTVTLHKPFKNTLYWTTVTSDYTTGLDHSPVIISKTTNTINFGSVHNTNGNANWIAKGYGTEIPQTERVLWCVKAFGNIDEGTGSTSLDSIATNIAQLNTKVDGFASGLIDSQATAIAEMQSYFTENMEETLLYSSLAGASTWDGNITFSDSYLNYDFIRIEFASAAAVTAEGITTQLLSTKAIKKQIQDARTNRTGKFQFDIGVSSWYWASTPASMTETYWAKNSNASVNPRRVWGYRLKATGITNKSAIDVSQISDKISSLLTTDNHLRLPSGLEVW